MATTSALKSNKSQLVGTQATKVGGYTVPPGNSANVNCLRLCNRYKAGNITFSVYIQDAGGVKTYWADTFALKPGQNFLLTGGEGKDIMVDGDSLWVVASVDNALDVTMSFLEDAA